jgi:hypothetical protein
MFRSMMLDRAPRRKAMHRLSIVRSLLCLVLGFGWLGSSSAQEEIVFPETGHRVSDRFLQFWQQQGGLAVFGYPISEQRSENGRAVQYFERQRFELHPENQPPYDVQLGLLGPEILAAQGSAWQTEPIAPGPAEGCTYFAVTRHNLCNQQAQSGFLSYWTSHGLEFDGRAGSSFAESLALFGYPITEPYQYTNSSGQIVQAQWFERARFEWHPNNPQPYRVLLGRLGAELGAPGGSRVLPAAAVQTVLDYYDALNRRSFEEAYHQWANDGAASKQTLEEFRAGFANTQQLSLLLGNPAVQSADRVEVPVTILGVVEVPRGGRRDQEAMQLRGSYLVQRSGGAWKLLSATIAPRNEPLPSAELMNPTSLLQFYYAAINRREFARAYTYWNDLGKASGQSFAEFQQGFAGTDRVAIMLGTPQGQGAAGSVFIDVPIVIVATQSDKSIRSYCGSYTVRGLSIPPFDKLGLRIESARIVETGSGVRPDSAAVQRMLDDCRQPEPGQPPRQ